MSVENDDLMNILNMVNNWISNCDTKSSILLAFVGVIVGVIFSNNYHFRLISLYFTNPLPISIGFVYYSIFLIITVLMLINGIRHIILSISPNFKINNSNNESLIFYANVSKNSFEEYKNKIKSQEYSLSDDLTSQIYINSKICTEKFENYKQGFEYVVWGFIFLIILIIVRCTVYVI